MYCKDFFSTVFYNEENDGGLKGNRRISSEPSRSSWEISFYFPNNIKMIRKKCEFAFSTTTTTTTTADCLNLLLGISLLVFVNVEGFFPTHDDRGLVDDGVVRAKVFARREIFLSPLLCLI